MKFMAINAVADLKASFNCLYLTASFVLKKDKKIIFENNLTSL